MSGRHNVAKRARTSASRVDLMASLPSLKKTNYTKFAYVLVNHMQSVSAHGTGEKDGWWCAHPEKMSSLISYLAEEPAESKEQEVWSTFRDGVATQLTVCRRCARNYHDAVAEWQMNSEHSKGLLKRIRSLVAWDADRIHRLLTRGMSNASSSNSIVERRRQCAEAILECLLSFRICLDPTISRTLGALFKKSSPVRNEELQLFLQDYAAVPSGLLALCLHPTTAVRSWAQRTYRAVSNTKVNSAALHYLLGKVVKLLPDSSSLNDPGQRAAASSAEDRTYAWDAFAGVFAHLSKRDIKSFSSTYDRGQLFEVVANGLQDADNEVVVLAESCATRMLGNLQFRELFALGAMSPDGLLDIVFQSFRANGRGRVAKETLLSLIAPILYNARDACARQAISRLFRKCFDFLYESSRPDRQMPSASWIQLSPGRINQSEMLRDRKNVMKTGASLLNWYYSHSSPSLPFDDPDKISTFVLNILREDPESEWGWDLLRTVLLTDVFNFIRCVKNERDANLIGKTFLLKRPDSVALRPEEERIMENVINVPRLKKSVMTWVGPLWQQLRKGRHVKKKLKSEKELVSAHEVRILLDLHRLIGMIDASYVERELSVGSKELSSTSAYHSGMTVSEGEFLCQCVRVIQDTIRVRFFEACRSLGDQEWWKELPFHATHLLASAQREMANKAFETLLRSKRLLDANCVGSHSKLLAHVLKSDSDGGSMMADGCVSSMRIISALGSTISVRTYASFLLWYRVLLDSKYVALVQNDSSSWALGVILTFVQGWKSLEKTTERGIFSEVTCRFLSNLRDVWRHFLNKNLEVGSSLDHSETHENMLNIVLKGLFGMSELKDPIPRASWVQTICSLAPSWRKVEEFRNLVVLIIEAHESLRNRLTLAQCQVLANSANLKEVDVVIRRWARQEEERRERARAKGRLEDTTIDRYFRKDADELVQMSRRLVEKKSLTTRFVGKRFAAKGGYTSGVVKRQVSMRTVHRPPGQSSALTDLRRDLRASRKDSGRGTRGQVLQRGNVQSTGEGGKTKFEMLVEKQRAEKEKRRAQQLGTEETYRAVNADEYSLAKDQLLPDVRGNASKHRLAQQDADVIDCEAAEDNRFLLPASRRRMESRLIEQVYRDLLSRQVPSSLDYRVVAKNFDAKPHRFEDVEAYVKYWEPVIIAEFRASLHRAVEEEMEFSDKEKSVGDYSLCRMLFEVDSPVDSVGYVQNLSLRCCEENTRDFCPREGSRESEFDVSKAQPSDLVLLRIAPPKVTQGCQTAVKEATALGLVKSIVRKSGQFSLKLNVAFEHSDMAPGKGRKVRVSRLTGTSTFQRQIDALWSLSGLSDGLLWAILEPREGLRINESFGVEQLKFCGKDAASRLGFVKEMQARELLNGSQAAAVEEVVRACAPIFRRVNQPPRVDSNLNLDHGSLTLIQGPPGTGKTSTVVGLLSTILLGGGNRSSWRRARVHLEDGPFVVKLAPIRALVCAPSNAAVDELMVRVMEEGLYVPSGHRVAPRMVRIGSGTTVDAIRGLEIRSLAQLNVNHDSLGQSVMYSTKQLNGFLSEMSGLQSKISAADKERREFESTLHETEAAKETYDAESREKARHFRQLTEKLTRLHNRKEEVGALLSEGRENRKNSEADRKRDNTRAICSLLNGASVVFATLSSAGHEVLRKFGAKFDVVIVDEAAQCGEPEALIPITGGQRVRKRNTASSHVVLVGDPKQLPATVISTEEDIERALGCSLFERIGAEGSVHMLNTQYRMHPSISLFPNSHFYHGLLRDGANVKSNTMHRSFHRDSQRRFGPVTFLDTSQSNAKEARNSRGSLYNSHEANVIVCVMISLLRIYGRHDFKGKVVVLSPYREQVALLRRKLAENALIRAACVEVSTVDGIQGREKSIVILSTVRSGHSRGIGFVDDDRRMNVAITRPKHSLIVVGNGTALATHSDLWSSHISHCHTHSCLSLLPVDPFQFFPEARANARVKQAPLLPPLEGENDAGVSKVGMQPLTPRSIARGVPLRSSRTDAGSRIICSPPRPQRVDGRQSIESVKAGRSEAAACYMGPMKLERSLATPSDSTLDTRPMKAGRPHATPSDPALVLESVKTRRPQATPSGSTKENRPAQVVRTGLAEGTSMSQLQGSDGNHTGLESNVHGLQSKRITGASTARLKAVDRSRPSVFSRLSLPADAARNLNVTPKKFSAFAPTKRRSGFRPQNGESKLSEKPAVKPKAPKASPNSFQWTASRGLKFGEKGPRNLQLHDSRNGASVSKRPGGNTAQPNQGICSLRGPPSRDGGRKQLPPRTKPKEEELRLISLHRNRKREISASGSARPAKKTKTSDTANVNRGSERERPHTNGFSLARTQLQMRRTCDMVRRAKGL